jgi:hypothetical protein
MRAEPGWIVEATLGDPASATSAGADRAVEALVRESADRLTNLEPSAR